MLTIFKTKINYEQWDCSEIFVYSCFRERAAKRRSLEKYAKAVNINPNLFKGRIREFDPSNLTATIGEVLRNQTIESDKTEMKFDHSIFSSDDSTVKQESSDPVSGIVEAEVVWCD